MNGNSPVIDTAFANKYYRGDKNNNELSRKLGSNQELEVIFQNPLTLIERFCEAQKKFVFLIKENQIIRELLDDKASIRDYYDSLSDDEVQDGGHNPFAYSFFKCSLSIGYTEIPRFSKKAC